MRAALLLSALLISQLATAAVTNKEVATCAAKNGDLERLNCYDQIAKKHKLNGPQSNKPETSGTGKWVVADDTNPIDDSRTVLLILDADEGKNKYGKAISLIARCKSNKTTLYINWEDYLGSKANVTSRTGKNKAETYLWSVSTDKTATFHPNPINALKAILKENSYIVQVTPYNESPVTAIFDTTGLVNAIKPLRETCNW